MEIEEFLALLDRLQPDSQPHWGVMGPQHMVEHLTQSVMISRGMPEIQVYNPEELAEKFKAALIYSDRPLSRGIKNPALPEQPSPLRHGQLNEAKEELHREWDHFKEYFRLNPQAKHNHPRLGKLTHEEWAVFHRKHFAHHLAQFGLL
jgi:oxepin-CoA hydrolase/3-oxo-5,6-dehydrosuberyl-CoA semialdehyde dehydrogenase